MILGRSRRARAAREEALEAENLLALAPVRLAAWDEADGRVIVLRPHPGGGPGSFVLLHRLLHALSMPRIRLDEVGSVAWLHLDGRRTVAEVAELLRERFGERVEPAEGRLGHLVRMLRGQSLLAYPGIDDVEGAATRVIPGTGLARGPAARRA